MQSVHSKKLLSYINKKTDKHVILEIKLSSLSKNFIGSNIIELFKSGLSRFFNKLSFKSNTTRRKCYFLQLISSQLWSKLGFN